MGGHLNLHSCGNISAEVRRHKLDSGYEFSVTTLKVTTNSGDFEINLFDTEIEVNVLCEVEHNEEGGQ